MTLILNKKLFFSSARIILDDDLLMEIMTEEKHSLITGISQNEIKFGPDVLVRHKKTINIDLRLDLKDIFSSFNETTRRYIRKGKNVPSLEIRNDDKDIKKLYKVYKDFNSLRGRKARRMAYFGQRTRFFAAYYKGEIISVVGCYDSFPYLRAWAIFSRRFNEDSKETRKIISIASRMIIYNVCKYGKNKDYKNFDLGAVNLTDKSKAGITSFKMSFGGDLVSEYTYTYKSPFLRKILKWKKKLKI